MTEDDTLQRLTELFIEAGACFSRATIAWSAGDYETGKAEMERHSAIFAQWKALRDRCGKTVH